MGFYEWTQESWPLPTRGSNFNLPVRDVWWTTIVLIVLRLLWSFRSPVVFAIAAAALMFEPAPLVFPYNVVTSLLTRTPRFWDVAAVDPALLKLHAHFADLQREAKAVLDEGGSVYFGDISIQQHRIAKGKDWKVFPFWAYDNMNADNCKRCPITAALLKSIPTVRLAMYSIHTGGTEIPLHVGFFRGVLRVHLTLWTDNEDPGMQRFIEVGGEKYSWKTGELVAFDDTYPHRVVNHVPGRRLVLFLDVTKPTGGWTRVFQDLADGLLRASPSVRHHAGLQETTRALPA